MDNRIRNILNNLKEEFAEGFKSAGQYFEVFINPSKSEIRDASHNNYIRLYANNSNNKFYVWHPDILHYEFADKMDKDVGTMQQYGIDTGASVRNGEINIDVSWIQARDARLEQICYEIIDGEYDWLSKYYVNVEYMKNSAREYLGIEEKFYTGTKSNRNQEYREIFVNPSRKEYNEIAEVEYGKIRFIAINKDREIYAAPADVFHWRITNEVGLGKNPDWSRIFSGIGEMKGGKFEPTHFTDNLIVNDDDIAAFYDLLEDLIHGQYDWMEKHYCTLDFIKEVARDEMDYIEDEHEDALRK